jgi:hypothetical protein
MRPFFLCVHCVFSLRSLRLRFKPQGSRLSGLKILHHKLIFTWKLEMFDTVSYC